MIISHRHKFIFIHCPKAGGSTIASMLAYHLGPRDLMIGSWEDAVQAGARPNRQFYMDAFGPRRFISTMTNLAKRDTALITSLSNSQKKLYRSKLGPQPAHAFASDIKAFDIESWERYYKFCFIRNPYSRLVSYYRWTQRSYFGTKREISFLEFLQSLISSERRANAIPKTWDMYTIDGKIAVDFIGKIESFETDINRVAHVLGLTLSSADTPKAKVAPKVDYRTFYGPQERAIADRLAAEECAEFGYTF